MPTKQTRVFWKTLARIYGHDPHVVFDLFNQPRRTAYRSTSQLWNRWQDGGTYGRHFWMGMQPLARYVRSLGDSNLFIVEGPRSGDVRHQPLWRRHEPGHPGYVEHQVRQRGQGGPRDRHRVDELRHQHADVLGERPDLGAGVPAVPRRARHGPDGLDAHAGVLVMSKDLTSPTQIRANWACRDSLNEGAGGQIMHWFAKHN